MSQLAINESAFQDSHALSVGNPEILSIKSQDPVTEVGFPISYQYQ